MSHKSLSVEASAKISNIGLICALLVVFKHVGMGFQIEFGSVTWYVHQFIAVQFGTVAVPFFFAVSGYFLARHDGETCWWKQALARRLWSLGIPYFVWNAVMFIWYRMLMPTLQGSDVHFGKGIFQAFGLSPFVSPVDGPMWYVRCLFLFVILSPLIFFLVKRWTCVSFAFVVICYFAFGHGHATFSNFWLPLNWQNFWRFFISTEGLLYFMIGAIAAFRRIEVGQRLAVGMSIFGLALGMVRVGLLACGLDDQGYLIPITIPCLLIGLWTFAPPPHAFRSWMVKMTFPIYVMHWIALSVIEFIVETYWGVERLSLPLLFLDWGLAVLGSVLVAMFLRKCFPKLTGLAFGGRF